LSMSMYNNTLALLENEVVYHFFWKHCLSTNPWLHYYSNLVNFTVSCVSDLPKKRILFHLSHQWLESVETNLWSPSLKRQNWHLLLIPQQCWFCFQTVLVSARELGLAHLILPGALFVSSLVPPQEPSLQSGDLGLFLHRSGERVGSCVSSENGLIWGPKPFKFHSWFALGS
jgi:hypothetical protein